MDISLDTPLTPETRAIGGDLTSGIPILLADGREWMLPRVGNERGLEDVRNRLYEEISFAGRVTINLLRTALVLALPFRYYLTNPEILTLTTETANWKIGTSYDGQRPIDAIIGAYLPFEEQCEFTYEDWFRSTLIVNGIDPLSLDPEDLPAVLTHLITLRRAVHPSQFVTSAIEGAKRKAARDIARFQRDMQSPCATTPND
jgi:hypothetical protein